VGLFFFVSLSYFMLCAPILEVPPSPFLPTVYVPYGVLWVRPEFFNPLQVAPPGLFTVNPALIKVLQLFGLP